MDIGTAGSQSLYSYQAALAGGSQSSAVFGALAHAYSQGSSYSNGNGDLADLVGQANLSPLVTAIYTQSQAQSTSSTSGIQGLSLGQVAGGLDASAATTLLTGLSSDASSGLQGFDSALTGASTLANLTSQARLAYGSGNLSADVRTQAATTNNQTTGTATAPASNDPASTAAYIVQATFAAQLAAMNNTFTLLA